MVSLQSFLHAVLVPNPLHRVPLRNLQESLHGMPVQVIHGIPLRSSQCKLLTHISLCKLSMPNFSAQELHATYLFCNMCCACSVHMLAQQFSGSTLRDAFVGETWRRRSKTTKPFCVKPANTTIQVSKPWIPSGILCSDKVTLQGTRPCDRGCRPMKLLPFRGNMTSPRALLCTWACGSPRSLLIPFAKGRVSGRRPEGTAQSWAGHH